MKSLPLSQSMGALVLSACVAVWSDRLIKRTLKFIDVHATLCNVNCVQELQEWRRVENKNFLTWSQISFHPGTCHYNGSEHNPLLSQRARTAPARTFSQSRCHLTVPEGRHRRQTPPEPPDISSRARTVSSSHASPLPTKSRVDNRDL